MSQELILNRSTIWLFGRVVADIVFDHQAYFDLPQNDLDAERQDTPQFLSQNTFLLNQLRSDQARFATIYSFAYQGGFYDLSVPTIFLVHGRGMDPENAGRVSPHFADVSRMPGEAGRTGLATMVGAFTRGIRAWTYDKADYTIRLDVETGMFDQVLLDAMLDGPGGFDVRGANARGANARGANARGANARGANARGANARGGGNSD
jgi:hypothetical protein